MLKNIIAVGIGILNIAYIFILGFHNLAKNLGWASILPIVLICFAVLLIRIKRYYKSLLLYTLFLIGMVAFNHIVQFIIANGNNISINILTIYMLHLGIGTIYFVYIILLTSAMKRTCVSSNEGEKIIKGVNLAIGYPFIVSYMLIFPFVRNSTNFYSLCLISLLPFIFSPIMNYCLFALLKREEIDLLLTIEERYPALLKKYRLFLSGLVSIGLVSLALEYFRGMWLFGIINTVLFLSIIFALHSIFRNVFRVKTSNPHPLTMLNALGSIKKWSSVGFITLLLIIVYIIVYVVYVILC
jgi:hypothetical protein